MSESQTAWLIRGGRRGEFEALFLEQGIAGLVWGQLPDLADVTARDQIKQMVRDAVPDATDRSVATYAGQRWAIRSRVKPGDLVVLPLKTKPQIALGLVKSGYKYRIDGDSTMRHCVSVDWQRTDVPRTAVAQDLLHSLGAMGSICQITRNDGVWRLGQILKTGADPGARVAVVDAPDAISEEGVDAGESSDPSFDIERLASDQILAFVAQQFAGHDLAHLVAAVLEAEGFFTEVSPPGPDGGIDVFAGSGPLGLDSPKLIVQVKSSPAPVNAMTVRELHGVLATHGAEQALLVAWGGVNKVAQRELQSQFFRIRVWDADDLLDAVLRNYDRLDEELRARLPLKRMWSLATEPAE